jgi:hypothetical protein
MDVRKKWWIHVNDRATAATGRERERERERREEGTYVYEDSLSF